MVANRREYRDDIGEELRRSGQMICGREMDDEDQKPRGRRRERSVERMRVMVITVIECF